MVDLRGSSANMENLLGIRSGPANRLKETVHQPQPQPLQGADPALVQILQMMQNRDANRDNSQKQFLMFPKESFTGEDKKKTKSHWAEFSKYLDYQDQQGTIPRDLAHLPKIKSMFKLMLQDIALGWFEMESPTWLSEDQMKQAFLKRFNPWGDTRRQQQDAWNKLKFDMTKDDMDSFVVDMKTLASILGHNDDVITEKFKDIFPDPNIEAALMEETLITSMIIKIEEPAAVKDSETFITIKGVDKTTHIEADKDSGMEMTLITMTETIGIEITMVKVILIGVEDGIIIVEVKDIMITGEGEDGIPINNITIQGINKNPNLRIQIIIVHYLWDINTDTQSHMNSTHTPNHHNSINHKCHQLHLSKLQIFVSCVIVKAIMTINVNLQAIS